MPLNPKLHHIIINEVRKVLGKKNEEPLTRYQIAKGTLVVKRVIWNAVRNTLLMTIGIFSAAFGLEGFLIPNGLIDGGVMGISLLTSRETGWSLSLLIIFINLPFVLMGWRQISKIFAIKSIIAITILAIVVATVHFPIVTNDKLLVAVFGGFFLGAGIGLNIRGGGVIDGTEILAIALSKKRSVSVGDFILVFNIVIFSVAAYLLSIEVALYSILTYLAASKTVDFILEGIEEFTSVTIISPHNKEIAQMIKEKMRRGLTVYSGKRGYGRSGENPNPIDIIFTIVTRLEITRLTGEIEKIDPNAFIVMQSIKDTRGGMVRKRPHNQDD
jgi:uncharacterized membrane-anchored protein YitT (DUF2179 family)